MQTENGPWEKAATERDRDSSRVLVRVQVAVRGRERVGVAQVNAMGTPPSLVTPAS